ncbi:MAG: UDP-2,4-diacetamido-2,4,6-trideoxy-beta-L-altropyranose hydrolase [Bacteroidota bacterium]
MKHYSTIYFRADGNSQMGLGHLIRSLALAEILAPEFSLHFITRSNHEAILSQIAEVCENYTILPPEVSTEEEVAYLLAQILTFPSIVILDGYHFDTAYQQTIRKKKIRLVAIDDIFQYPFWTDAIINHAGGIGPERYQANRQTAFYLGPKYALLRRAFRLPMASPPPPNRSSHLFICLGGADPQNDTLKVIEKCEALQVDRHLYIVLGSANRHVALVENRLAKTTLRYTILRNLSAAKMASYMEDCGMAITSPSTVAYEYLSRGGLLFLLPIAANQKHLFRYLTSEGLALPWSQFPSVDEKLRAQLLAKQRQVFDGQLEQRLYKIFRDLDYQLYCRIREVNENDLHLLHRWTNDPLTRQYSSDPNPIPMVEHRQWFFEKLNNPKSFLFILEFGAQPVGQIRFDVQENRVVISYSISKDFRQRGFGMPLLQNGIQQFKSKKPTPILMVGYVMKSNMASIALFERLNFYREGVMDYGGSYLFKLKI